MNRINCFPQILSLKIVKNCPSNHLVFCLIFGNFEMRWIFLLAIFALSAAQDVIDLDLEEYEESNEVVVKPFNKCGRNHYYDIYQAHCSPCTLCKPGEFEVQDCSVFDNRVCSTCESRIYAHTLPHILKCVFANQHGYEILDGLKGKLDKDTPYKIIENDHLSVSDEVEAEEVNDKSKEVIMDTVEYTNDDAENNVEDSAPVSSEEFEFNSVEVVEHNVVPQIDELIEFDDSDADDKEEEDSDEEEMVSINKAQPIDEANYLSYLRLIRIYLFIGGAAFVSLLLSAFYCCRVSRTEKTFAIIEPPTTTPEEHHVLVRSLDFVKNKHRGFFKYEPLEEFV
uniref:TNFR-Cys domain-containing protein n=1 Tax=Panagrolaimus sp. JU765 TaxID=591449 RepID=A0AC34QHV1_9BILA